MVGIDPFGVLFIHDAGNNEIRMREKNGYVHTLIHGACRHDKNIGVPKIPFELELRGMICYKNWKTEMVKPHTVL